MPYSIRKSNLEKLIFSLCLCIFLVCGPGVAVYAHRVNLFAWVEGDRIYVESKFSGGKRVNAAKIIVTDSGGTELLSGTTNEKGEFSFKIPQKSDLKIVLLAGTGHRAAWTIAASEMAASASGKKQAPQKGGTVKKLLIGMGFIFGLAAIVAFIRKRKKNRPQSTKH